MPETLGESKSLRKFILSKRAGEAHYLYSEIIAITYSLAIT